MLALVLLLLVTNAFTKITAENNISESPGTCDELLKEYNLLKSEYENLLSNFGSVMTEFDSLKRIYNSLQSDYTTLRRQLESLQIAYESLSSTNIGLTEEFEILRSSYDSVLSSLLFARNLTYVLTANAAAFAIIALLFALNRKRMH